MAGCINELTLTYRTSWKLSETYNILIIKRNVQHPIKNQTYVIQMSELNETGIQDEIARELKNVKKLIKYLEGYPQTPDGQKARLTGMIEHLKDKVRTGDLEELKALESRLKQQLESSEQRIAQRSYIDHIRGWYLRPLVNHFDSALKISSFTSGTEGATALNRNLKLYLADPYLKGSQEKTILELHQFFKFKASGKGTTASAELEERFYDQLEFTDENPLSGTTMGQLGLPSLQYNLTNFIDKLKNGETSVLVTGLCPLSTIGNELGLVLADGKVVRPILGFEPLQVEHDDIIDINWPKRPIISDYVVLRNILEQYKHWKNKGRLSVIIWYPYHEYYLELTENIFNNYLTSGLLSTGQIHSGLTKLKQRYFRLIELVRTELGLTGSDAENEIKIIEVDKNKYNDLEKVKTKIDLSFFKYIYGSWVGNELRRRLYEQLMIKHIKPVFDGVNTLHLDTSYELWPDMLGACVVERDGLRGNYSFVNYPSMPSISLSHMREYNAPYDDKVYLGEDETIFRRRVERLPKKYVLHVAPVVAWRDGLGRKDRSEDEIVDEFRMKLLTLNKKMLRKVNND